MSKKDNKDFGLKFLKISFIFFFFIILISTQYFAYKVKYNNSLGGFRILNTKHKAYFPLAYIFWQKKYIKNVPKLIENINWYLFMATGTYLVITLLILKKKNVSTVHGSARWATYSEIEKMDLYKETGVVLGCDPRGRLLHDNSDRHLAFFAPTRMGKGINSVTPTCYDWIHSIVINDIKGELWGLTAGYRKEVLGQKVFMFCPVDTEGISCSLNNLDFIEIGTKNEMKDISVISQTLIDVDGKGDSDHWITSAINFINAVILHVKYAIPGASLVDVIEFISPTTGSLSDRLADILGVPREDEEDETGVALRSGCTQDEISYDEKGEMQYPTKGYATFNHLEHYKDKDLFKKNYKYKGTELDKNATLHPIVAKEFMTLFKTPDKERGSIISSATQKLKIFMDPIIAEHIRHSDFTIQQLRDEKCSLYLVTPPDSLKRTQALLRLTFTQIVFKLTNRMKFDINKKGKMNFIGKLVNKMSIKLNQIIDYFFPKIKKDKNPILLLIDEFPSLGKLDVIEQSMSYIAGYGLKTFLISQSLGQFKKIYGKDNYILDNCSIQLYLTPNDPETPKMLSDKLGKYTVKTESYSKKGFELTPTKSISYIGRSLMTAEEIGTLPYEEILLLITGQKPIKGKKLFYYKDDRYVDKLYPTPEISDKSPKKIITDEDKRKEDLKEKFKNIEKWIILTDNPELDYDEELEEIENNYKIASKLTYEELLNYKFELAYKYSLINIENIENAKNKFFKTENIEKITKITNDSLDRTNELIAER